MSKRPQNVPAWALEYDTAEHPPYAYTADVVGLALSHEAGELEVLVVERGQEPFQGYVAVPGGFVDSEKDEDARRAGLRELREETGARDPDYIESLDTYDANGRDPRQFAGRIIDGHFVRRGNRVVSRTDLALFRQRKRVRPQRGEDAVRAHWSAVSRYLPWEDTRTVAGRTARKHVLAALPERAADMGPAWQARLAHAFGANIAEWNEERAGERLRMLIEARLVEEALRDRYGQVHDADRVPAFGEPMAFDHRVMLADGIGRLRGRLKYVPALLVALTPPRFTVAELQAVVEAAAGRPLEAANFRRLVAHSKSHALIVPTGEVTRSGGRPAEIYAWKTDFAHVRLERSLRLPWLTS
jgi:hypothetical protein